MTRGVTIVACLLGALGGLVPPALAECARSDFESVVDAAAGSLRDMNAANKPKFQEKLRQLKEKRGWSQDQFLREGAPLVADDKIATFDQQSSALLEKIATGGEAGAAAAKPDCSVLESLRASMKTLVETQAAKWIYMTTRIDAELAK